MNWDDSQFSYIRPYDPEDIFFDDLPVESLIFRNELYGKPTPADIITFWDQGFDLTAKMRKVLAGVLVNNVNIAFSLDRSEEAGLLLKRELVSETKYSPDYKVQILIALWKIYCKMDPNEGERYYLIAEKLINRYHDQLDDLTLDNWNEVCQNTDPGVNPFQPHPEGWNNMT